VPYETVQNLGVNNLPLLLASGRPGHRDHSIPSAKYPFCSCSPPRFWTVSWRDAARQIARTPHVPIALEALASVDFPPFGSSKKPGLTRFGGVGRNPRTKAAHSQIQPPSKTRNQLKPNLFIKIPGTPEGLPAITDAIFAGVPVNVTLLFSTDQYKAAADAYMKGLERRVDAGLSADVRSVASLFVSRWDVAVADKVPTELRNTLGVAVSKQAYKAYRNILESDRFQRLENVGARAQRLLFASTGTKDKTASDTLYVAGLAAPNTVNTMPEGTLLVFADHGETATALPRDGGDAESVLAKHIKAGIDLTALSAQLQSEGANGFVKSWNELLGAIKSKSQVLT
jgi:transaldolase